MIAQGKAGKSFVEEVAFEEWLGSLVLKNLPNSSSVNKSITT